MTSPSPTCALLLTTFFDLFKKEARMAEKKRLHNFLNEMLKLSCVKGFQHFATHTRGREEMVCSIVNEPSMPIIQSATNSPAVSFSRPQRREAVPMSHKQQRRLSGYGFIDVGLPPASPSENEEVDDTQTMFLIAGYARYNRPYVWVRTNHERLVRLSSEEEKDYPLMLQTTSHWQEKDVKVWDVLNELIEVCAAPCPPNPFAVDLDYFRNLPLVERALASGAMIQFLQKLIASGPHQYDRKVVSDIGKIGDIHFTAMQRMVREGIVKTSSSPSPLPPSSQPSQPDKRDTKQKKTATTTSILVTTIAGGLTQGPGPSVAKVLSPPVHSSTHSPSQPGNPVSLSQPSPAVDLPRPTLATAHHRPGVNFTPSTGVSSTPAVVKHGVSPISGGVNPGVGYTPIGVRPGVQHSTPLGVTPNPAPPRPTLPQPSSNTPQTGGQFYSRRMAGSYNY